MLSPLPLSGRSTREGRYPHLSKAVQPTATHSPPFEKPPPAAASSNESQWESNSAVWACVLKVVHQGPSPARAASHSAVPPVRAFKAESARTLAAHIALLVVDRFGESSRSRPTGSRHPCTLYSDSFVRTGMAHSRCCCRRVPPIGDVLVAAPGRQECRSRRSPSGRSSGRRRAMGSSRGRLAGLGKERGDVRGFQEPFRLQTRRRAS